MKIAPIRTTLFLLAVLITMDCSSSKPTINTNFRRNYPTPTPAPTVDPSIENTRRLGENTAEYARLPSSSRMTGSPYFNGRAIALTKDAEEKEYRQDYSLLDNDVRAESPEDVGTVVLVTYRRQKFGTYTTTGYDHLPGYVMVGELTIVDRSIPAVIYRKTFRGERPGENVDISMSQTEIVGTEPTDKISEFLSKLRRR
jgi:hypothetical protein